MTDDTANRMWPVVSAGAGVGQSSKPQTQEGSRMHDTTADDSHHHGTAELAS